MRPLLIGGDRAGSPPSTTCTLAIRNGRLTSTPIFGRIALNTSRSRNAGEWIKPTEAV